MPSLITSTNDSFHLIDALGGFLVAIFLTSLNQWLFKKICYCKLIGKFYHGKSREIKVVIKHIYGERFLITEYIDEKIKWKGAYKRQAKSLLTGTYDYNYNKESKKADWGNHHLHLLPNNKTISVLYEPIVPGGEKNANSWER